MTAPTEEGTTVPEPTDPAANPLPAWTVTNWRCTDHPRENWILVPTPTGAPVWIDEDTPWRSATQYDTVEDLRSAHPNLIANAVDNLHALVAAENTCRQMWYATVRAEQAKPRDKSRDDAEAAIWAAVHQKVQAANDERDQALALARWLLALDEPGNPDRPTVTLSQIIGRARALLDQP